MDRFYHYEGKLATYPIITFLAKHSHTCYGMLLDIGCGNKPYKKIFSYIEKYVGIDRIGGKADIVADVKFLPIDSHSTDIVLCNQVLEHDREPNSIVAEISRVLKKNGQLILSAPQMGRLHGEPDDYYRFTKYGLCYLLEQNGFTVEVIEAHGGIFRALGSHVNFFIIEYFGKSEYLKNALRYTIITLNNFVFALLDRLMPWQKDTLGYNLIAKKHSD